MKLYATVTSEKGDREAKKGADTHLVAKFNYKNWHLGDIVLERYLIGTDNESVRLVFAGAGGSKPVTLKNIKA